MGHQTDTSNPQSRMAALSISEVRTSVKLDEVIASVELTAYLLELVLENWDWLDAR